ncbi:MAG: NUDIX hydrolase, partial [Patescibacteria group bacterium]
TFFSIREVLVETPAGVQAHFYLRDAEDFSVMIPFLNEFEVIMVRQHRVGPDYISLEFPMGTALGKTPQEAASTELAEETGYSSTDVSPVGSFYLSNSSSAQQVHVFTAKNLHEGERHLESTEMIEVLTVKWSEVGTFIKEGKIKDGPTITAYGMYMNLYGNSAENMR